MPGVVSQAKGDSEKIYEAEEIPTINTDGLKRITLKNGSKNLKRLKPKVSQAKKVTLWGMLTSSLKFKTPDYIRNRVS